MIRVSKPIELFSNKNTVSFIQERHTNLDFIKITIKTFLL